MAHPFAATLESYIWAEAQLQLSRLNNFHGSQAIYGSFIAEQSYQTQFTKSMISNHSYSKPDEISNQSALPEHEDVMDHKSSTGKDDDPAAQAPALPVTPGFNVNKKVAITKVPPEDYSCGITCGGRFMGKHQCIYSIDKPRAIKCLAESWYEWWRTGVCNEVFKNRGDFNRHYRTCHLSREAILENRIPCPVQGCRKTGIWGFNRYDNLLQHRRRYHKEDIPKVHVTPRMKAPKPYARKNADPNGAGPSNASN